MKRLLVNGLAALGIGLAVAGGAYAKGHGGHSSGPHGGHHSGHYSSHHNGAQRGSQHNGAVHGGHYHGGHHHGGYHRGHAPRYYASARANWQRYWNNRYHRYVWYDPGYSVWYYWSAPDQCYYLLDDYDGD
jgi:hypothetical protein